MDQICDPLSRDSLAGRCKTPFTWFDKLTTGFDRPVLNSRPFPSTKLRTNGLRIEGLRANGERLSAQG